MAILAAVLIPTVTSKVREAADSSTVSDVTTILSQTSLIVAGDYSGYTDAAAAGDAIEAMAEDNETITSVTASDADGELVSVVIVFTLKTDDAAKGLPGDSAAWTAGTFTATYTVATGATAYTRNAD